MRRKKYMKKRDIQYNSDTGKYHCPNCNNGYSRRDTMLAHYRYECGKAPRYKCPYCNLCSKKTSNIYQHVRCMHPKEQVTLVKLYWARGSTSHRDQEEARRGLKVFGATCRAKLLVASQGSFVSPDNVSSFVRSLYWLWRENVVFRLWLLTTKERELRYLYNILYKCWAYRERLSEDLSKSCEFWKTLHVMPLYMWSATCNASIFI